MSLLKALGKAVLRTGNEFLFKSDKKRAKQKAYDNVGSTINRATKNGLYIDGILAYKKEPFGSFCYNRLLHFTILKS